VQLLLCCSGLQGPGCLRAQNQQQQQRDNDCNLNLGQQDAYKGSDPSSAATSTVQSFSVQEGSNSAETSKEASSKPRALQVYFYLQELCMPAGHQESESGPPQGVSSRCTILPAGVVCCPGPSPSMVGCTAAVEEAQRLLALHFPKVKDDKELRAVEMQTELTET